MAIKKLTENTEYNYSKIKWRDKDIAKLKSAFTTYRKKVPKNERLPYFESMKSLKKEFIYSRKDFNRAISILESVTKKGAFKPVHYTTENQRLTMPKWKYEALKKLDRPNQVRLQTELNKAYDEAEKSMTPVKNIYGSSRKSSGGKDMYYVGLPDENVTKLESYITTGTNFEFMKKAEDRFREREIVERIVRRSSNMFDYKRDEIYKQNYTEMFERYSNLDGYDEVMEMLESIDSKNFYNVIKDVDEQGSKLFEDHYYNPMIQAEFDNYRYMLKMRLEQGMVFKSKEAGKSAYRMN